MGDNLGMAQLLAVTSLAMPLHMQFLNDILDIWKPGYQGRQEQERQEQERQERERQEQEEDEQEEDEMEKDETEEDDIEEELTDYIVVGPISNDIHKNTGAL